MCNKLYSLNYKKVNIMTRTPLINTHGKIDKARVLAYSEKGMDGFFAAIEKMKSEAAAQQIAKQQ